MTEHHGLGGAGSPTELRQIPDNDKIHWPESFVLELLVLFLGSYCRTPVFCEPKTRLAGASRTKTHV